MNNLFEKLKKITGVMVSYYFICKRKLWLFARNIQLENENEHVLIGKQIHEESYSKTKKDITILDTINIDFINRKDKLILNEVKKSSKNEKADHYQMLYYLYFLSEFGVNAEGEIRYSKENKKKHIVLTEENKKEILLILDKIEKIIEGSLPKNIKTSRCTKCAYKDFCYVV
ncbi:MAG: CRISPR-associated protein Cas4 [Candidatus Heimdallarchaeum endolithica]|uniref:CRISPR-associated exonuclease Cas4 n=1 Tax=Candidatus Heimdallarchaeum endolithica TaxID=2876572 RepID=A0A9Y1BR05_9ARCH|nr:MAG: CRISPR-associated protein Cas4 [Candidatus Heimdallarchaeum endolithica]